MSKEEKDIGTFFLIVLIIMISVGITGINLLTMFGVITSPDMLTYSVYLGLIFVPVLIIGGAVYKIVIEQKKALENLLGEPSNEGDKLELKINLKENETAMADTTIHPVFYLKISISSFLSVLTGLFVFLAISEGIRGDILTIYPIILPLVFVISIIHLFSNDLFEPKGWGEFLEHTWIALFTISLSVSFMLSMKIYVQTNYPRTLWETFLGLPFSLQTIMYFIIMLLLGGVLVKIGDILQLRSSPFKSSGITLVLVSMVFLIPQFQFIPLDHLHDLITKAFSIVLIFYGVVTACLLYKDAGLRYVVTNERIIKLNTHKLENSYNYMLDRFKKVKVVEDTFAQKFGYGNVIVILNKIVDGGKYVNLCVLRGVKKPHLLVDTIKALAESKKIKKVIRKKPKKRADNESDESLRSKIIILLLFGTLLFTPTLHSEGYEIYSETPDVEEFHTIVFQNLTDIDMGSEYNIYMMKIGDDHFSSDEIRELYSEDKETVEESISDYIDSQLRNTVELIFQFDDERDKGEYDYEITIDKSSLESYASGPIIVTSKVYVKLYPIYYQIPQSADLEDLIYGTLKIGGSFEKEISVFCGADHTSSYTIESPPELNFVDEDGRQSNITIDIDNLGKSQTTKNYTLQVVHTDAVELKTVEQNLDLKIDVYELKRDVDREYLSINTNLSLQIDSISIPSEFVSKLPDILFIDRINADFLRLLYESGFEEEVNTYITEMEEEIENKIDSVSDMRSKGDFSVIGLERSYDIGCMDSQIPISVYHNASLQKNISEDEVLNSFQIQRRYLIDEQFSVDLQSFPDRGLNYTIVLPEGLELITAVIEEDELDIRVHEDGRYYIQDELYPDESATIVLTVGTYIDLFSFLPFIMIMAILFFTWLGLESYPIKKKRKEKF